MQLNTDGVSIREIGRRLGISRNSIRKYLLLLNDNVEIDDNKKLADKSDTPTGNLIACQVFVAILPFIGLIYCLAVPLQKTYDFATCINAMLRYYAGVPATILCDNLKTAVIRPSRYEPVFTDLCYQLNEHYQTTFSATRPYSPRDKAMVERAVNIVYTHVYAPLRHATFTSLQALALGLQAEAIGERTISNEEVTINRTNAGSMPCYVRCFIIPLS